MAQNEKKRFWDFVINYNVLLLGYIYFVIFKFFINMIFKVILTQKLFCVCLDHGFRFIKVAQSALKKPANEPL